MSDSDGQTGSYFGRAGLSAPVRSDFRQREILIEQLFDVPNLEHYRQIKRRLGGRQPPEERRAIDDTTERPAPMTGLVRRSIAEQKEAIGRMSAERIGEMTGLAKCRLRRYRIKMFDWGSEDAVQDALHALSLAAANDELGAVASDGDLWKLFCTTLDNEVLHALEHDTTQKRGGPGAPRTKRTAGKAPRAESRGSRVKASSEWTAISIDSPAPPSLMRRKWTPARRSIG